MPVECISLLFFLKPLNSSALVIVHPDVKNWIKYARFEEKHGYIAHGRKVFERSVEFFGEEHVDENLFVAFARFEEKQKEVSKSDTLNHVSFIPTYLYCGQQNNTTFLSLCLLV